MKAVRWDVDIDYFAFESALFEAAQAAFTDLRTRFKDETLYTYSLLTNLNFESVGIGADSEERLTARAIDKREAYRQRLDITMGDARALCRYRFREFGSDSEVHYRETFASCNAMLADFSSQVGDLIEYNRAIIVPDAVKDVVNYLHERMEFVFLKVMCALDESGVFETPFRQETFLERILSFARSAPEEDMRPKITLLVTRRDVSGEVDDFSVLLVNPPEVAARFKAELELAGEIESRLRGEGRAV